MPRSSQRRGLKKSRNRAWTGASDYEKNDVLGKMRLLEEIAANIDGPTEEQIYKINSDDCSTVLGLWEGIARFLKKYKIAINHGGKLYNALITTASYLKYDCRKIDENYYDVFDDEKRDFEKLPYIEVTTGYNVTVKDGIRLEGAEKGKGTIYTRL